MRNRRCATEITACRHAFTADPGDTAACQDMIGLSVSHDPQSPINKSVMLHGGRRVDEQGNLAVGRLQHIAYAAEPHLEMREVREELASAARAE